MKRTANAIWRGDGLTGAGTLTTQSGALKNQPYTFAMRFVSEDGKTGTNPEELIGAAHAGCYSMALSFMLSEAGFKPEELNTTAEVEVRKIDGNWTITGIALRLRAKAPGIDAAKFQELAHAAKAGCPVSRALGAVPISLTAELI